MSIPDRCFWIVRGRERIHVPMCFGGIQDPEGCTCGSTADQLSMERAVRQKLQRQLEHLTQSCERLQARLGLELGHREAVLIRYGLGSKRRRLP